MDLNKEESAADLSSATDNYLDSLNEQSKSELDTEGEQSQDANSTEGEEQSAIELDKIEKFKFKGKDYSIKDLERFESLQSDYTKKSQSYAQERKFAENVYADLAKVKANPSLAEQFKQIYPKHYHSLVDLFKAQDAKKEQNGQNFVDPKFLEEFNGIKSELQQWKEAQYQAKVEADTQKLVALEETMTKKYPKADLELVYAKMGSMIDSGRITTDKQVAEEQGIPLLTNEVWEKLYKDVHEKFDKLTKTEQVNVFNKVSQTNKKASSVGRGGTPPAQAPKKVSSIGDATDAFLEDYEKGNFKL